MTAHAAARRQRIHRIRVTVAAVALAVFIALFATIYVQMAAGRDPMLGRHATTTTGAVTAAPAPTATPATTGETAPAPVTTAQS
jgi:hypothetical protein